MVRQKKNASGFFDLRLVHQDRDEENVESHQTRNRRILRAFRLEIGEY